MQMDGSVQKLMKDRQGWSLYKEKGRDVMC